MTDRGLVLVLSAPEDATADAVETQLRARRVGAVRVDTGDFPTRIRLDARNTAGRWAGCLRAPTATVELDRVRSVYYRRPTRFRLPPGLSSGDAAFAAEVDGPIVCKTFSSLLLADGDTATSVFTTTVDPAGIDPDQLAATAHLLQECIPKAYDVRVTVVGRSVFAVAVHTDSPAGRADWRADYRNLRYEPATVPDDVRDAMAAYLDRFGLRFGAFDFVVDPDDAWWFLECNPNGQWLWLQDEADQPIASALAALLAGQEQCP